MGLCRARCEQRFIIHTGRVLEELKDHQGGSDSEVMRPGC